MSDLQETPAVPPTDYRGDERLGYHLGGGLLIFLGFGVFVTLNLLAHAQAGVSGAHLGPLVLHSQLGEFAWATVGLGIFLGVVGVVMLLLGRRAARGPIVLPVYPY